MIGHCLLTNNIQSCDPWFCGFVTFCLSTLKLPKSKLNSELAKIESNIVWNFIKWHLLFFFSFYVSSKSNRNLNGKVNGKHKYVNICIVSQYSYFTFWKRWFINFGLNIFCTLLWYFYKNDTLLTRIIVLSTKKQTKMHQNLSVSNFFTKMSWCLKFQPFSLNSEAVMFGCCQVARGVARRQCGGAQNSAVRKKSF